MSTLDSQPNLTMTQTLTEDDLYRTSSQYRLWSFSSEGLATLRRQTHELAVERAKRYGLSSDAVTNGGEVVDQTNGAVEGECLTEVEELRLVQRYCDQIRTTSDHFKWPNNVKVCIREQCVH